MRGNFSDSIKGRFVNAIFYFEIPCCFVCVLAILAGGILPGGLLLERALHLTQPQQPEKVPSAGRAPRTPYTATQTLLLPSWPRGSCRLSPQCAPYGLHQHVDQRYS